MNASPFLTFDYEFPPTVILEPPQTSASQQKKWMVARLTIQLTARFKAWAALLAVCSAVGFFSGATIAHIRSYLQHQHAAPAQQALSARQPAPSAGWEQIPLSEPFSVSLAMDMEPVRPAAQRVIDSVRAVVGASVVEDAGRPSGMAEAAAAVHTGPLQTLLVILGALGALGTAAVGAVNNWFVMLH